MGWGPTSYPIRHHHRLGATRSTALVATNSDAGRHAGQRRSRWLVPPTNNLKPPRHSTHRARTKRSGRAKAKQSGGDGSGHRSSRPAIIWLRRRPAAGGAPSSSPSSTPGTTGLDHPRSGDRVGDFVHADGLGALTDTFTWRTRPEDGRHGAEHIHHISEADLATAPPFSAVADEVSKRTLRGRTLVAHNAPFDTRFLSSTGGPGGPSRSAPATVVHAGVGIPLEHGPLRLSEVARALGSPQPGTAHRAADDAVATAQLLAPLLNRAGIAQASELPLVDGNARSASLRSSRPAGRRSAI